MIVHVTLTDPSINTAEYQFTDRDAAEVAAFVLMIASRTGQPVPQPVAMPSDAVYGMAGYGL